MKIKTDLKGLLIKQSDGFILASKLFLVHLCSSNTLILGIRLILRVQGFYAKEKICFSLSNSYGKSEQLF